MDCIFCKINDGSIPSFTIYENEVLRVFLDINPDTNGHLLIIPKKHYKDLMEIDNDTLVSIMNTAREMKKLLEETKFGVYGHLSNKEKLNIDGLTLIQNNGDVQEVKHFHLHLKPYYNNNQEIKEVKEVYELLTK